MASNRSNPPTGQSNNAKPGSATPEGTTGLPDAQAQSDCRSEPEVDREKVIEGVGRDAEINPDSVAGGGRKVPARNTPSSPRANP